MTPPRRATLNSSASNSDTATTPLAFRSLTVSYGAKLALWDLNVTVQNRSLMAVIGPNGGGKSTMIKSVLGLTPVISGDVLVFDTAVKNARKRVAYMPQRTSVNWDFPASAEDVVAMGLYRKIGWCRPVRRRHRDAARAFLDRLGISNLADRQIGQLSGGQQQRVFLARTLAQDADLYLMDEPFAGIDAATERVIVDLFHDIRANGATVLCVHHDLQTVHDYFDHALVLNMRAIASGPVNVVINEENLQSAYGGRLATNEIRAITKAG